MIMIETKITNQAYCCNRLGYDVVFFPVITKTAFGAKGGGSPGHMGSTPGLEHIVDARPRSKCGELRGPCRHKMDPAH